MPIHINLLAEAQAAEEMRRHDPVKRAIFIGISLVALTLLWSGVVEINAILAKERLDGVQTAINAKNSPYQRVMTDKNKIEMLQRKLAALQKLQASRFLQGSLLNALQHATVDNVQLTRLRMDQAYFLTEGTDPQTNGTRVIAGRPATVRERITLHLDARDFSANPGDQVNHYKDAQLKQDFFKLNLDTVSGVRLASLSALQTPPDSKPFVLFTLECRFLDKTP